MYEKQGVVSMKATGMKGTEYKLFDPSLIGSGGEGDVFRAFVPKVVKIYKAGVLTYELESKIRIMTENPPNESVLTQVAWPLDVIYNNKAQCIGFIMPDLSINAELGEIYK